MLDISAFYKIFLNKKRGLKPRIWLRGVYKKIDILPISALCGGNHGKIRKNN